MKVTKEFLLLCGKKLIAYYQHLDPFDSKRLITDVIRLSEPIRLYRVLCMSAYLGKEEFADGILTKDILKVTGWKLPDKATDSQIKQDKIISKKLEMKCMQYIGKDTLNKIVKNNKCVLPVEWRMFYIVFVPGGIFTQEERLFMKNNPCWLIDLFDELPE